jgi:hypothetical protein
VQNAAAVLGSSVVICGGAGNGGEVVTWRGELEVAAMSLGYSPVSASALVQAATDLRPATAATLAGLGP